MALWQVRFAPIDRHRGGDEVGIQSVTRRAFLVLHAPRSVALADFFSILLTHRRMNPVAHIVRDRNHADAMTTCSTNDFPGLDLLGPCQEIASAPRSSVRPHPTLTVMAPLTAT